MFQALIRRATNGDRAVEATTEKKASPGQASGLHLGGGAARGLPISASCACWPNTGSNRTSWSAHPSAPSSAPVMRTESCPSLKRWACGLTTRGVLGYLDVSLGGSGLIGGDRLASRLEGTLGDTQIEDLPKRYACIATELGTGHEIWLTHGRIVDAARASYALPGIFTPVRLGGRWLVDGALVNPVPVSAARALGARLVIAVNLNSDLLGTRGHHRQSRTQMKKTSVC